MAHLLPPSLPLGLAPWELLLVDSGDPELPPLLLVVESAGGQVRHAVPLVEGQLAAALVRAATHPDPPTRPCRPRVLRCGPALAADLRAATAGWDTKVEVGDTPVAEQVFQADLAALAAGGTAPPVPGIHVRLERWRETFHALALHIAWRSAGEVVLRFSGQPDLRDVVAVLTPLPFELSVYDGEAAWSRARAGEPGVPATVLTLHPAEEASPRERETLAAGGWMLPGGAWPLVLRRLGPELGTSATEDQELQLLAALQAVVRAPRAWVERPYVVHTVLGEVTVTAAHATPRAVSGAALVFFHRGRLIVRQGRGDALATAARLAGADTLLVADRDGVLVAELLAAGSPLGTLGPIAPPAPLPSTLSLLVSAGGTVAPMFRAREVVATFELAVRLAPS